MQSAESWVRYFDEHSRAYYWHNSLTGESQWDEADEGVEMTSLIQPTAPSGSSVPSAAATAGGGGSGQVRQVDLECLEGLERPDDHSEMDGSTKTYTIFIWINIVLVEGPACCIEACFRAVFLVLLVLILWCLLTPLGAFSRHTALETTFIIFRDICLTMATVTSLLIPGMLCFAYRHMDLDQPWELSPLPTVCGWVDSRRFAVVTLLGAGATAGNVDGSGCQDSWEKALVYWPRSVVMKLQRLAVRG